MKTFISQVIGFFVWCLFMYAVLCSDGWVYNFAVFSISTSMPLFIFIFIIAMFGVINYVRYGELDKLKAAGTPTYVIVTGVISTSAYIYLGFFYWAALRLAVMITGLVYYFLVRCGVKVLSEKGWAK